MNKKAYKLIKDYGFDIKESLDKTFDFEMFINDITINVKVFKTPSSANVTINNKYMWQILDGKRHMRFIRSTNKFMDSKKEHKVILFTSTSQLRKWINECEMVFINPSIDIYGARICRLNNLEDFKNLNWE